MNGRQWKLTVFISQAPINLCRALLTV